MMKRSIIENLAQLKTEERNLALRDAVSSYLDLQEPELVHKLLWEEAIDGWGSTVNAWYHAWEIYWRADPLAYPESEGFTEEYLHGVRAAWDDAEAAWERTQTSAERSKIVGLVARYALITASIRGLSLATDPGMIKLLIASGMWSRIQAFNFVRQIPDMKQRLNLLDNLGSDIGGNTRYDEAVLATLQDITGPEEQANWLRHFAGRLSSSDARCKAVEIAIRIPTSYGRIDWGAYALEGMAPCLREYLNSEDRVFDLAFAWHGPEPYRVLRAVVPHLSLPLAKNLFEEDSLQVLSLSVEEEQALLSQLLIHIANGNEAGNDDADGGMGVNRSQEGVGDPEWALRHIETKCYIVAQAATLSGILFTAKLTERQQEEVEAQLLRARHYLMRKAWLDMRPGVAGYPGYHTLSETPIEGAEEVFTFVKPPGEPHAGNVDMLSSYLPYLPEIAFSQAVNWVFEQWDEGNDPWIWSQLASGLSVQQNHRLFALLLAQLESRKNHGITRPSGQHRFLREIIADVPEDLCNVVFRLAKQLLWSVLHENIYFFADVMRDEIDEIVAELIVPLARRFDGRLVSSALDLVQLIDDDLATLSGLAALAFGLPEDTCKYALALLTHLDGRVADLGNEDTTLSSLAIAATQLALHSRDESMRLDLFHRALTLATSIYDDERRSVTLLRLGGLLGDLLRQDLIPEDWVRELIQAAQRAARYRSDSLKTVLALASLFPRLSNSARKQAKGPLLAAVNREYPKQSKDSLFGKAVQRERSSILKKINSTAKPHDLGSRTDSRTAMNELFSRWTLQMRQFAENPRPRLLAALPEMLSDIERLGGYAGIEEVYWATEKVGKWWPQQPDDYTEVSHTESSPTEHIGARVLDSQERLVGFVNDSGEIYDALGQRAGRIAQETVLTSDSAASYEVRVYVLNARDEPVAGMTNRSVSKDSKPPMFDLSLGETYLEESAFLPNDITVIVSATGQRLGHVEGDMPWHAIGAKALLYRFLL